MLLQVRTTPSHLSSPGNQYAFLCHGSLKCLDCTKFSLFCTGNHTGQLECDLGKNCTVTSQIIARHVTECAWTCFALKFPLYCIPTYYENLMDNFSYFNEGRNTRKIVPWPIHMCWPARLAALLINLQDGSSKSYWCSEYPLAPFS